MRGEYGSYDYKTDSCSNPNTRQSKGSKTPRFTASKAKKKSSDQCKIDEKSPDQSKVDRRIEIVYRIDEHPDLAREAEKAHKSIGNEITTMIGKLEAGNKNPGLGNKPLKGVKSRISEARSRNGARVFHRERRDGKVEVLAVASRHNAKSVTKFLEEIYKKLKSKSNNNNL